MKTLHFRVPLDRPRPDIDHFTDFLRGRKTTGKPPLAELIIDKAVMKPILEERMGRKWIDIGDKKEYIGSASDINPDNRDVIHAFLDNTIAFWYHMGYDHVRIASSLDLPAISHVVSDTAQTPAAQSRAWQETSQGVISNWEDFEKYPWPTINENTFSMHRYICDHLPEGAGFITAHAGGVYEHVSRLLGYEPLCLMLYDKPELVRAVTDKVGGLIEQYNRHLSQLDELTAIMQGDDFGFNTGTLIAPCHLREYFLGWHKKYAQMCHDAGKLYFLHSCGQIGAIMDDLIDDVKIDAKHSFQDNAMSIIESKKRYGDRIGLLGGVDVNVLATYDPPRLRRYVRNVIEQCSPGGRFAIGSGNSICSYIPVENYLTMVDEALR